MSRTLSEKLDHMAVLADRLSNGELLSYRSRNGGPLHRLGEAFIASTEAELDVTHAVVVARAAGHTWTEIGSVLGTSGEAASKRYGSARREMACAAPVVQLRIPLRGAAAPGAAWPAAGAPAILTSS